MISQQWEAWRLFLKESKTTKKTTGFSIAEGMNRGLKSLFSTTMDVDIKAFEAVFQDLATRQI
jgi:hypothetical protein